MKTRIYAAPAVKGVKGLAHHLVLLMVVKNSKLVWCINNFLIVYFIAYHYRLEYFNNKVRIDHGNVWI